MGKEIPATNDRAADLEAVRAWAVGYQQRHRKKRRG